MKKHYLECGLENYGQSIKLKAKSAINDLLKECEDALSDIQDFEDTKKALFDEVNKEQAEYLESIGGGGKLPDGMNERIESFKDALMATHSQKALMRINIANLKKASKLF